ncbi:MAG: hypothetical protein R3F49_21045 [Planctomycetota bacterium]
MRTTIAIAPETGSHRMTSAPDDPAPGVGRLREPASSGAPSSPQGDQGTRGGARAHALNFSQLVGSHLGVAIAGLASLPLLARNLGPAAYGQFSLFMTTLGVLSNLDLARPILVRELARSDARGSATAQSLALTSALALAAVAFGVGVALQGLGVGSALGVAVLLHGASAAAYADLSGRGKVGLAGSVRNGFWAGALALTVALSFATTTPHAYIWAFAAANLGILATYWRLADARLGAFFVAPRARLLHVHRSQAGNIAAFAGASAVVASADKMLLEHHAPKDAFGHYAAQYDLATKINIVSTALGSILLPAFARLHETSGRDAAARRFVHVASWITLAYFVVIGSLVVFHREVMDLVLGRGFAQGLDVDVYALMLVGVFIHLFGFLLTAYQRACGDFRTHRIAYIGSATLMVVVGLFAIPRFGALGAAITYLCGRTAELTLIGVEVCRMPRAVLPRWRLAALGSMVAVLAATALFTFLQGAQPV